MARKRSAACELAQQPKRAKRLTSPASLDTTYEDHGNDDNGSDLESHASYCLSERSDLDTQFPTPVTPFSPSSAKYPSDLKTHVCPYPDCDKAFNRPARLAEHIRSHNNERIFSCTHDGCDKTFLRASHLNHHVKSAHTSSRDYVCDREGCGKSFVTGSRLRRHLAAHEGRDKYRCTGYSRCNETFRKHSTLQKHIKMVHLNEKPFPCPHVDPVTGTQCTQAFDTAGHLRAHEGRVHGGAKFVCTECSKQPGDKIEMFEAIAEPQPLAEFATYALLQAHMKAVHPPTCPNCSLQCSSTKELRRHLEVAHGSVPLEERKLYPCSYPSCDRSFTKKGNLNVHVRTVHEGEKKFACGETDLSTSTKVEGWSGEGACGKRYGSKLALEEHVRTAHLGLKNAKAARREQLGLPPRQSRSKRQDISKLAMLTGHGYVEESGRHIPCLIEGCEHRFHREYDLWVHMSAKHGLEENDIQILCMQRAMEGGDQSFDYDFGLAQEGLHGASDSIVKAETENMDAIDPLLIFHGVE